MKKQLTQEYLKELFDYDEEGYLVWKVRKAKNTKVGSRTSSKPNKTTGYIMVKVDGKSYQVSRLIYIWHNGDIPNGLVIDHKDNDRINDRIENLQLITQRNNTRKRLKNVDNTSGYKGVTYNKRAKKYQAQIGYEGIKIYLGYFDDPVEAANAYDLSAYELFGSRYAITNFPIERFFV